MVAFSSGVSDSRNLVSRVSPVNPPRTMLMSLTSANSTKAVMRKLMIAIINAPQSIYTDFDISATNSMPCFAHSAAVRPSAFFATSIVMSPCKSPIGIALMRGLKMLLTRAVTIAVNAAPIIIPTARSTTLPFVMNALNSLRSLNSGFLKSFFIKVISPIVDAKNNIVLLVF